jgi:hypothetical protein
MTGKQRAREWLNKKLKKYGNTYFSPASDKTKLNALIQKFGNTSENKENRQCKRP